PFYYYIRCLLRHTRDLLSFPTRRSSDLPWMVYKHNSLIFDFYIVIALEFVVNAAAIGYLSSLQYRLRSSENSFFRNRNPKVQAAHAIVVYLVTASVHHKPPPSRARHFSVSACSTCTFNQYHCT